MPEYDDIKRLVDETRPRVVELAPAEVRRRIADGAQLIDVRDDEELLRNPPLAGAVHLSRGRLEYMISDAVSGKDEPIVLYCGGGLRSVLAADSLRQLGYREVYVLKGGLHAWRDAAGQPWMTAQAHHSAGGQWARL